MCILTYYLFFFFNDTATTEIYTLSLHDALPISVRSSGRTRTVPRARSEPDIPCTEALLLLASPSPSNRRTSAALLVTEDRKSTRLNSSHANISYAVFCLKKKNNTDQLMCHLIFT